jgi:N-acetyltransferase 10
MFPLTTKTSPTITPAHHLFVLLPPLKDNGDDETSLPVVLEGNINRNAILEGLGRGWRAGSDMMPWLILQQFQES